LRRGHIEMKAAILTALVEKPLSVTWIGRVTGLEYNVGRTLLAELVQQKMIVKIKKKYCLTEEGKHILGHLNTIGVISE